MKGVGDERGERSGQASRSGAMAVVEMSKAHGLQRTARRDAVKRQKMSEGQGVDDEERTERSTRAPDEYAVVRQKFLAPDSRLPRAEICSQ